MATIMQAQESRDFRPFHRPWTLFADLVTGVADRRESRRYSKNILREWLSETSGDTKEIQFIDRRNTFGLNSSDLYQMSGATDDIISDIDRTYQTLENEPSYGMQFLRYRNGKTRITINGASQLGSTY